MNAVYIHISKTAGMTIAEALRLNPCRYMRRAKTFCQSGAVTFGHMDYLKLIKNGIVSKAFHESAFKFTFVRNPYDRAVSNYFWNIKKKEIPAHIPFEDYTEKYLHITKSQVDYVDGIKLDFIGRYERLMKDLDKIARVLGIEIYNVPHRNKTRHKPFTKYYTEKARINVLAFYKEDFDRFGYDHNLLHS